MSDQVVITDQFYAQTIDDIPSESPGFQSIKLLDTGGFGGIFFHPGWEYSTYGNAEYPFGGLTYKGTDENISAVYITTTAYSADILYTDSSVSDRAVATTGEIEILADPDKIIEKINFFFFGTNAFDYHDISVTEISSVSGVRLLWTNFIKTVEIIA